VNSSPASRRVTIHRGRGAARASFGLALVAAAFVVVSPRAAHADTDDLLGALKRVEKVEFEGNEHVSDGAIRKVIRTGSGSFLGLSSPPLFRPDFLRSDAITIRNLYVRRGYLDAEVTASADSGEKSTRVVVTYHIAEGPLVRVRNVRVDSAITVYEPKDLLDWIETKPGKPFDPVQVALDREEISKRYTERGHFPTVSSETTRDSLWMDVDLRVIEGPAYRIRHVPVEGVARVDTSAVRREILLQPGKPFVRERLTESTERLYQTGLFTTVDIVPTIVDSTNGWVDLSTRVRERLPRWVEGGIGTGTQEIVRVSGQWGHRNLGGDGKRLTADAAFAWVSPDTTDQISAKLVGSFVEPWFLGTRMQGILAVSAEQQFEIFANRTYREQAVGFTVGLSREFFSARSRVTATMDNFWTKSVVFRQSEGDTTEPAFLAPYIRRVTLAFDQDRRDDPLYPREGLLANLTFQVATAARGEEGRYLKSEAQFARHFPIAKRSSFGARVRLGRISPWGDWHASEDITLERTPASERYRAGGGSTVRGYHDNGIDAGGNGGLLLMVTNFELIVPLRGAFGLTGFVDGGNAWRHWSDFKPRQFFETSGVNGTEAQNDYKWSFGAGIRYASPIGPIRLDVGRRLHEDEGDFIAQREQQHVMWHLGFGAHF
jgi:outer membrane protein assembly complex protein YaeT